MSGVFRDFKAKSKVRLMYLVVKKTTNKLQTMYVEVKKQEAKYGRCILRLKCNKQWTRDGFLC